MNNKYTGGMGHLLREEPFWSMWAEFATWRMDVFIRQLEASKKKGRVLPFVRGLRLSAQLIYVIRDVLSGSGLTANWGHLLDESEAFCSCECDVIIHRDGHIRQWDGSAEPIMDFRFIRQDQAIAVISCKSYLRSSDVDKEYCKSMKAFVEKIWLFAECCGPRSVESIRKKALERGYEKFWPLYTWSKQKDPVPNSTAWTDFIREVEKLKQLAQD